MKPALESPQDAASICRQMQSIRLNVDNNVDGLMTNARQLVNWRHYVQAFPWASLGAAAALGYLIVPRKHDIDGATAETLQKRAGDQPRHPQHSPKSEQKPGLLASVANLTGNMLLRAGVAYAGQQIGKVLGQQAAAEAPPEMSTS